IAAHHPFPVFFLRLIGRRRPGYYVALGRCEGRPPAADDELVPVAEGGDQNPEGRDGPDHDEQKHREVHGPGESRALSDRRAHFMSFLASRTFQYMIGTTMSMMTSAMVEARPKSRPRNIQSNM